MRQIPTRELELILLCARMQTGDDDARRIAVALDHDLDWSGLVSLAQRHGVTSLLYRTLSGLHAERVPTGVLERLRSLFETNRFRNLVLVTELVKVLRALEAGGVIATPYKGPALAAALYADSTLRQSLDIDVLVKPKDALHARRILLNLGYVPKHQRFAVSESAFARFHCEFAFTTAERQLLVELSWRFAPWYFRMPEVPDAAWERLGCLTLAGVSVPWFAPEELLFVLCLHGCKHKWRSLKWIVDIAELLRVHPELDWREMMENANRTGAKRMLALGLFLAHDLLDARVPAEVLDVVRRTPSIMPLALEVCNTLGTADGEPGSTLTILPFIARVAERLETRLFCRALLLPYFLLHHVVRPGAAALRRVMPG